MINVSERGLPMINPAQQHLNWLPQGSLNYVGKP
jgi:hypothetical protein